MDDFLKIYNLKKKPLNDNKLKFRYICLKNLESIKKIIIPNILVNLPNEVVLIEFRNFHHIEFLLRNAILKINKKSNWSFSIVCGELNYGLICNIRDRIHQNIKIYKLNMENVDQSEYSMLLTNESFWNMFNGEKLLIMQEDSFIFKENLEEFLEYDYIGAPWKKNQNDTPNCVGNGGLSLRTKSIMLKILKFESITNTKFKQSTKNYMKHCNLEFPPEDVYFSKIMQTYNIGNIADFETAKKFSSESIYNKISFGGHCFWKGCEYWEEELNNNLKKLYNEYIDLSKYDYIKIIPLSEININLKNKLKFQVVETPFDFISNKSIENIFNSIIDKYKINKEDFKYNNNNLLLNKKYGFLYDYQHDNLPLQEIVDKYENKFIRLFNIMRNKTRKIFVFILFNNSINQKQLEEFIKKIYNKIRDIKIIIYYNFKPINEYTKISNVICEFKVTNNINEYKKFIINKLKNLNNLCETKIN